MNAQVKRALIPILRQMVSGKITVSFRQRSTAEWILHRVQKPSPMRNKPSRERKEAKAAQHREETGALRAAVFARAGGCCELGCGGTLAVELHHLEGGSGRRALQAVSNCVAACFACHRAYHHRPEDFRAAVLAWASVYSYPVPRRFKRAA